MWNMYQTTFNFTKNYIVDYIDIDYSLWLSWCLAPLLITFLLPGVIVVLLYINVFVLYIVKLHWRTMKIALQTPDKWDAGRRIIAALWDVHGYIWHGYEVQGWENMPDTGPALIIYYHGAIPIDMYYFIARTIFHKNRLIQTVADYFLFKIPGFSIIADCLKTIPGTVQTCSNVLKDGNLLAIAPGGVYEAQFSTYYNLMWKKRLGFAKVALEAQVPIIPVFSENLRESFRTLSIGRKFFLKVYSKLKIPIAPIYGGFPVKMITHIGKPIPYDPTLTPEELQGKVADAINNLIRLHQRQPGNILYALMDRIPYIRKRHCKQDD